MEITGKIERRTVGIGAWALVTAEQQVYELRKLPKEYQQADLQVSVTGKILEDAMSLAMIGPIFEVSGCSKL